MKSTIQGCLASQYTQSKRGSLHALHAKLLPHHSKPLRLDGLITTSIHMTAASNKRLSPLELPVDLIIISGNIGKPSFSAELALL